MYDMRPLLEKRWFCYASGFLGGIALTTLFVRGSPPDIAIHLSDDMNTKLESGRFLDPGELKGIFGSVAQEICDRTVTRKLGEDADAADYIREHGACMSTIFPEPEGKNPPQPRQKPYEYGLPDIGGPDGDDWTLPEKSVREWPSGPVA